MWWVCVSSVSLPLCAHHALHFIAFVECVVVGGAGCSLLFRSMTWLWLHMMLFAMTLPSLSELEDLSLPGGG